MNKKQKAYLPLKRLIDFIGSFVGIIFCFAFLWWWVVIINCIVCHGRPVFANFRVGKNGKPFRCVKFRSMSKKANPNMTSRDKDAKLYVTKFGSFLRKTSIDETPQLLNVFVGQMSFIGPRPLIGESEDIITINKRKENSSIVLRPGLTGYAQINGRETLDPVIKGEMDGFYFKNFGFWFDIKIFFITIFQALGIKK